MWSQLDVSDPILHTFEAVLTDHENPQSSSTHQRQDHDRSPANLHRVPPNEYVPLLDVPLASVELLRLGLHAL